MADLLEIQQLLYRYCYAHDSRNEEMLRSCFAKDAELLGAKGRDNIVATFMSGYKRNLDKGAQKMFARADELRGRERQRESVILKLIDPPQP